MKGLVVLISCIAALLLAVQAQEPRLWWGVEGHRIVDGLGHPVFLRGANHTGMEWNGNQHNGFPPTPEEYQDFEKWGFNVVRVPITWANLEPDPPVEGQHRYNQAYLAALDEVVRQFGLHHVRVIFSMHQWAWCSRWEGQGADKKRIGCGFPPWLYERGQWTPARAREAFFRDQDNQWQGFLDCWALIAKRYADNPNVAGADMFNEPSLDPNYGDSGKWPVHIPLDTFYARVAERIRVENPKLMLIFEDSPSTPVYHPEGGWIYSFHVYHPHWHGPGQGLVQADRDSRRWDGPCWIGEFRIGPQGQSANGTQGWARQTEDMLRWCSNHGVGWAYWPANAGGLRPLMQTPALADILRRAP